MYAQEDYIFFWKTNEIYGWASQWYPCKIRIPTMTLDQKPQVVDLPSVEHYMMLRKALLFNDISIAKEILEVTGASSSDMAYVKQLGRKVQGFDEETWVEAREQIVLEGNILKFQQNGDLREKLLATAGKKLVEASPRDRIWGVGFGEKNALRQKDRWGLNLLGKALERTREEISAVPVIVETASTE